MISLLIVDDHPHQADGIAHIVTESGLPFIGAVYKAYSAKEALECFAAHRVDIVITDIRMPEMSGIELISRIRESSRQVKCVLLSGYAEFEYAQRAMELHASKYLMKPVKDSELLDTLHKLHGEIMTEANRTQMYQQAVHAMRVHTPLIREAFLRDLIEGKAILRRDLERRLQALELPFTAGDEVLFFAIQLEDDLSGYNGHDKALISYAVGNIGEELLQDSFDVWYTAMNDRIIAFVLKPRENKGLHAADRLERRAKEFQRSVYRYLKHMISVGIVSSPVAFPDELNEASHKSRLLFRNREDKVAGLFAIISELPQPKLSGLIDSLYQPPSLSNLMEIGRWEEAYEKLRDIFAELEHKWTDSPEYAQEAFFVIAGSFQFVSHKEGKQLVDMIGPLYASMLEKHTTWDLRSFRDWAFKSLQCIAELAEEQKPGYRSTTLSLAQRIQQYIERHLNEDLSLPLIAEELGFHPAYLSKVYKSETGQTLSDYLLKRRMEHAAVLLRKTDSKIYEVAEQTGYQTAHYFIKLFKNYYGVTPQQFRQGQSGKR
ncbi:MULTISPECIES: response regulator transcription factor [Paenibacillus]|uniref:Response regulator n=1 Tax=Paenibacillus campinasensis TaxID=66347 RepID=A0A268F3U0_9BACL|nr:MULTISPECIES: response regulator [Paenibacillus]MUG64764.1 response regulator [Paenibacillus campinasensis]PAD80047.1 hypothetical protein CHH67_01900 [Paenibacillus campinasensis]PAK55474.1 hypothetical protein CHH75_04350 [Paenibacillus sp. 7541]